MCSLGKYREITMIQVSLPSLRVSPREDTNDGLPIAIQTWPTAIQTWPTAAGSPPRAFFNGSFSPRTEAQLGLDTACDNTVESPRTEAQLGLDTACDNTVESLPPIRNDSKEKTAEGLDLKKTTKAQIRSEWAAYKVARRVDGLYRR